VDLVERIGEATDNRVDQRCVAHPGAPTSVLHPVGASAHRLRTARQDDFRIAALNRLGGRDDRLNTAATQAVDRERRRLLGDAGPDANDARHIHVLGGGVDDVAKHHLLDLIGLQSGALDRRARHGRPELGGRDVTQAASKRADGRTGR
jgi:hypothetical protein